MALKNYVRTLNDMKIDMSRIKICRSTVVEPRVWWGWIPNSYSRNGAAVGHQSLSPDSNSSPGVNRVKVRDDPVSAVGFVSAIWF